MKSKTMEKVKWKVKGKDSGKAKWKAKGKTNGKANGIAKEKERINSPGYVLMRIEECIRLSNSAKQSKVMIDKLYEATKYMAELEVLEKKGLYKGKPKAKDYISSFVNRKDKMLMEGIERAFENGESKEKILENDKFFNEEIRDFLEKL